MRNNYLSNHSGFTLVETIIYMAIASIFITFATGFYWQMRQADVKSSVSHEVKENAAQSLELVKYIVRNAQDVDLNDSVFGSDTGVLDLDYSDGGRRFDTFEHQVTVGGKSMLIRSLRFDHAGQYSAQVTSDHINVTRFRVSDYSQGNTPKTVRVELELEQVNPGDDQNFDASVSEAVTLSVRKEI